MIPDKTRREDLRRLLADSLPLPWTARLARGGSLRYVIDMGEGDVAPQLRVSVFGGEAAEMSARATMQLVAAMRAELPALLAAAERLEEVEAEKKVSGSYTVRTWAKRRGALGGPDAQALEGALIMTDAKLARIEDAIDQHLSTPGVEKDDAGYVEKVAAARARLAEVEAQAAAGRWAMENLWIPPDPPERAGRRPGFWLCCGDSPIHAATCRVGTALSGSAGRALLERVARMEAALRAASVLLRPDRGQPRDDFPNVASVRASIEEALR